ncbi:glycosyltransferase [Bacteroides sp.]|uniref:glycosyltransferase n=1 Tax=Bacteroides sp. TaxID=29523 RepID=UPI00260A1860|nr:glycosyltransferase [Bacteroides sp.]MDD3040473.1 glycosyltransferase [Bacteroides sp.]
MKIAVIHSGNLGFFPRFYLDLCSSVDKAGDEIMAFVPNTGQNRRRMLDREILWGTKFNWFAHFNLYKWTGIQDIWSVLSTRDLNKKLKAYNPDVIHLHGVNEYILCFPLFVRLLNNLGKPVAWTLHDTRYITARCASFEEDQCLQWQTGCKKCTTNAIYSKSKVNNVHLQWKLKKKWFNLIKNLTIVTPSQWLANHVKNSFLQDKPCIVLNNGIDTSGFSKPLDIKIPALESIKGKILLGVATGWEHRKGLDTMIWLSQHLPEGYQIVLVGGVRPDLVDTIPSNIICLPRTSSKEELIAIYQRADVYVNPTLADNFPTVNIEALGAGLPVVTFRTGGSAESIDESCGIGVEKGNNQALLEAIMEVCQHPEKYSRENCIKRSQDFSLTQFDKYVELYNSLVNV